MRAIIISCTEEILLVLQPRVSYPSNSTVLAIDTTSSSYLMLLHMTDSN